MDAFSLFRGTNMAVVTSCENRELNCPLCPGFNMKEVAASLGHLRRQLVCHICR